MKTKLSILEPCPMLLSLALLALAVAAAAQLSEVPPVSMGLWQTETTSTVTGIENTPMAGIAQALGRPHVSPSCLTPEEWKSDIQGFNAKQQHGCTITNLHQDAHEISFDEACGGGGGGPNNSHVDIHIDNAEHAHGTVLMNIAAPNFPQPITVTVSMLSHYLGSACGDVKPGEGKTIK